jgi:molecular chaperone HscB
MIDFSRNYFELFGLEPRFRLDAAALDRAYRELQSDVHPDRYAAGNDEQQRLALQSSARVNEAHRTLKSPVARAEYLLSLHGRVAGDDAADRSLDVNFLEQQLERRETASEAADAQDSDVLDALLRDLRSEVRERERELAELIDSRRAFDEAGVRTRELKFLTKLAEDVDGMIVALED